MSKTVMRNARKHQDSKYPRKLYPQRATKQAQNEFSDSYIDIKLKGEHIISSNNRKSQESSPISGYSETAPTKLPLSIPKFRGLPSENQEVSSLPSITGSKRANVPSRTDFFLESGGSIFNRDEKSLMLEKKHAQQVQMKNTLERQIAEKHKVQSYDVFEDPIIEHNRRKKVPNSVDSYKGDYCNINRMGLSIQKCGSNT